LVLNPLAFVDTTNEEQEQEESRYIVGGDDPCIVELTRLPFPEEAQPKHEKNVGVLAACDEANPWANAPASLVRAAAKHLFV
jgi:hypothetical protein